MWLEFEVIALVVVFSQSLCHFHTRMVDALSRIGSRKQVTISLSSFHGSGAVSSFALQVDSMEEDLVRMATELTRQANQMHEMQLELQRIATTTSQAEERAKVAEEKACAAVMAIGMVKTPEQKKAKHQQP